MTSTRRIICICSGNICRSPMAVAMLRHKLADCDLSAVVISGGTLGIQGRPADRFARRAIDELNKKMGEIIEEHRSQGVSAQMLERADDILVMAPRHAEHVERLAPGCADRIVRLWEYADDDTLTEIPDPVGHDATVFRGCRDLIEDCVDGWLAEWIDAPD